MGSVTFLTEPPALHPTRTPSSGPRCSRPGHCRAQLFPQRVPLQQRRGYQMSKEHHLTPPPAGQTYAPLHRRRKRGSERGRTSCPASRGPLHERAPHGSAQDADTRSPPRLQVSETRGSHSPARAPPPRPTPAPGSRPPREERAWAANRWPGTPAPPAPFHCPETPPPAQAREAARAARRRRRLARGNYGHAPGGGRAGGGPPRA